MASLRDYIGSECPVCHADILQAAPPLARMPPGEYACCLSCESRLDLKELTARSTPQRGFLARWFGPPTRA